MQISISSTWTEEAALSTLVNHRHADISRFTHIQHLLGLYTFIDLCLTFSPIYGHILIDTNEFDTPLCSAYNFKSKHLVTVSGKQIQKTNTDFYYVRTN